MSDEEEDWEEGERGGDEGDLFVDEAFPADENSIGCTYGGKDMAEQVHFWERASKFAPVLFENIEPSDIGQGILGDC